MTFKPHISISIVILFFTAVAIFIGCSRYNFPRDNSYTIENSYQKVIKSYPEIKIADSRVEQKINSYTDIEYFKTDKRGLKLDIYTPVENKNEKTLRPVILMIHGGGWSAGSRSHMNTMAKEFASRGYIAIPVEYRLSPENIYPAGVLDLLQSIDWIRNNIIKYNGDKNKIFTLGASAGAHLATLIGITEDRPVPYNRPPSISPIKGIINIDGIVSFIHPEAGLEGKSAGKWLGGGRETHWNKWKEASPLEYVSSESPPMLFINGSQPRFHAGRDSLITRYNNYDIYTHVYEFQDAPHTFWFFDLWYRPMMEEIFAFLEYVSKINEKSFPGAEGYGSNTEGGNKGRVVFVDNLNDSGPGSLREAIREKGARIIMFRVSGTIPLESTLEIKNDSITIAGQTAPGDGICIRNYSLDIDADQVIIRYMRFRLGDESKTQADATSCRLQKNILLDHCSFSWSIDETLSLYTNQNTTVQWCIISESLNNSVHKKGAHGYGGIWGGVRASFHHNLIAHHNSRNPRFSGLTVKGDIPNRQVDFYNNVIYNWRSNSIYGNEAGEVNIVNNYFKAGPATPKDRKNRIMDPSLHPMGKLYVHGNFVTNDPKVTENNWSGGIHTEHIDSVFSPSPFNMITSQIEAAKSAYSKVLKHAGASYKRDAVDQRIVAEVKGGFTTFKGSISGYPGIIDSQNDVGGWPTLKTTTPPEDSDNDGLPDVWEIKNGFNSNESNTNPTLIMKYINGLCSNTN